MKHSNIPCLLEAQEKAILVGIHRPFQPRWETEGYLDELALLADTAGAEVVGRIIQERRRIEPTTFIGKGKANFLANLVAQLGADLVIFDEDLSPVQVRNLENITQVKVIDRSGLILDVFARRAKSKEAKTQVELAQLRYLLPRLTRRWGHLSRQYGGIGTRGPGETQLEVDRRLVKKRISILVQDLQKIEKQRCLRRRGRRDVFKVALVGYTNSGKSTLLNALANTHVAVENRLFVTLDPTVRAVKLNAHQKILLIDTVGFIRKLPHHLVASFHSTLEEAIFADMLLMVVDISDHDFRDHIAVVRDVLSELGILGKPTLIVFNKVDRLTDPRIIVQVKSQYQPCMIVSAQRGIFLEDLKQEILRFLEERTVKNEMECDLKEAQL
ncbi:GTPase HflX [candidate division KSB1 bacterium 4484_219]|nr:MAG: GTPase HflX [candidate division KSB1 bacterium 4484_219]